MSALAKEIAEAVMGARFGISCRVSKDEVAAADAAIAPLVKVLIWIRDNPGAHPANVNFVAITALDKVVVQS